MKTNAEIMDELQKLVYMYGLNSVIRYNRVRDEMHQTQSVAEHVTNILTCAYFFKDIIKEGVNLDMGVVSRRALIHDVGEIETGDVVTVKKTARDNHREHRAVLSAIKKVPRPIGEGLESDFRAVEEGLDLEGRFVQAMDKFDGFFFQAIGDGIEMIRVVTPDIAVRKDYIEGIDSIMEKLGFPEIVPYVQIAREDMISRGYLENN